MKLRSRDLGAWILLLALACLILSPLTPCYSIPRHVDPSQVSEELPLPTGLLKLYGEVVGALVKGNFTKADLNLRKLVEVYAPPNLRYVYDRFNELLRREEALLNLTASKLREASELLEGGELA